MRKVTSVIALGLLGMMACSDDSNLGGTGSPSTDEPGASQPDPTDPGQGKPVEEIQGDITADKSLSSDKQYLLKGLVSVKSGATLTIAKGTVIKGDNATKAILLVEAGAKINAEGTEDEPIVFTSQAAAGERKPGDWGGVVILGKAPINVTDTNGNPIQANIEGILKSVKGTSTGYGGSDANDSSGVLRYVRIEYAGVLIEKDNEVNGLTLGGVGRGTKIDHIQVRKALDDCFEFFGGTVDAKYLVCQHNEDDGFDFDLGYSGRLQFLVLQQSPDHPGEDNGFESDNDELASAKTPFTAPKVYNVTLCGKNKDTEQQQYGLLLRRSTRGVYKNLVVTGFEAALDLRNGVAGPAGTGDLSITNSVFFGFKGASLTDGLVYDETLSLTQEEKDIDTGVNTSATQEEKNAVAAKKARLDYNDDSAFSELDFLKAAPANNLFVDPQIAGCFNATAPVFGPATSLTANAATPPADDFFDATAAYVGAFKDVNDTWATKGKWVVWSDQ